MNEYNNITLEELRNEAQVRLQTLQNANLGAEATTALGRFADTIVKIRDRFGEDEESKVWGEYREQVAKIIQQNVGNREVNREPQGFMTVEELMLNLGGGERTE